MLERTYDEVVILKHSLQSPKIYQLKNPTSKGWGRYVRLEEVHDWLLLHPPAVSRMDFFFGNNSRPLIIGINHSDGSRQTEQIPLFDSVQIPLPLEQDKEC